MKEFNGNGEVYIVDLMPDLHGKGWLNRLSCAVKGKDKQYTISQRTTTLEWCCSCMGWIMSHKRLGHYECKHLIALGLQGLKEKEQPPKEIIEIIGAVRWYTQQARRFGEVTLVQ